MSLPYSLSVDGDIWFALKHDDDDDDDVTLLKFLFKNYAFLKCDYCLHSFEKKIDTVAFIVLWSEMLSITTLSLTSSSLS